jgi:hypothetical protein
MLAERPRCRLAAESDDTRASGWRERVLGSHTRGFTAGFYSGNPLPGPRQSMAERADSADNSATGTLRR